ncbi:MAG TPA: ribonuclease III family protein [Candidatus Acidoferrales bacterium]|nr:ribonuclease III family protein [Candidatus Acidoferrales bacterium]
MSKSDHVRQVMLDKQLASLGDAFVNFVYSLALTQVNGRPKGVKISDRDLSEAFRLAGLRGYLGTRISKKDLANASESLLVEAYRAHLLSVEESVQTIIHNPEGSKAGLVDLLKLAVSRLEAS